MKRRSRRLEEDEDDYKKETRKKEWVSNYEDEDIDANVARDEEDGTSHFRDNADKETEETRIKEKINKNQWKKNEEMR